MNALLKKELYAYSINPFYYAAAILFCLLCSLGFFFAANFFVMGSGAGSGSANLTPFFLLMPLFSSLLVPALCLNIQSRAFDKSLPFSALQKNAARILAALLVFALTLLPTLFVPLCVNLFGDVDGGAALTGYFGIILFALSAISFCVFLSLLIEENRAAYFALSVLLLSAVNFLHTVPAVMNLPEGSVRLIKAMSLAWHFDSFGKGIFSVRDALFFVITAAAFLALSVLVEESKKGKNYFSRNCFFRTATIFLIFVFAGLVSSNLNFRLDLSRSKMYSLSPYTKKILSSKGGASKIRITYYCSPELSNLYPQVRDVDYFLASLERESPDVLYKKISSPPKNPEELGIRPLQIQRQAENRMEYVDTYSAVVFDYGGRVQVIPAAFSTASLEYDLNLRLESLFGKTERAVSVLIGNGMSEAEDYSTALEWLKIEGFVPRIIQGGLSAGGSAFGGMEIPKEFPLVIFGSKNLSGEQVFAIKNFLDEKGSGKGDVSESGKNNGGGKMLAFLSPYSVDVNGSWALSKNERDYLLPLLEQKGFSFSPNLAADLSAVRASFYSAGTENTPGINGGDYKSVNYPLWISVLPQKSIPAGASVFWASPLILDEEKVLPLWTSSAASWQFIPDKKNPGLLFDTNPFTVPKAPVSDPLVKRGQSVLAASSENITVVSGDLFVHNLLLSLSGGEEGDFRNLNFLSSQLLRINGEAELAALKDKGAADSSLYKITDAEQYSRTVGQTLLINLIFAPLTVVIFMLIILGKRKNALKKI